MDRYGKAIAAAAVPVFLALILWAVTGTLNEPELATALSGLLAALIVYFVPNTHEPVSPARKRSPRAEKGEPR